MQQGEFELINRLSKKRFGKIDDRPSLQNLIVQSDRRIWPTTVVIIATSSKELIIKAKNRGKKYDNSSKN
jgi:hypothetical protein